MRQRVWPGSSTWAASTSIRTRSALTTWTTPTSCGSTSIRCRECPYSQVREVALVIREALDAVGLVGWPKTSGSRGIHVNVRIEPSWTYPQVRRAALALARDVERRAPSIATSKWWKEERHGVFLDYNQNAKDRTVASAYSVRPTPDARVSAPLTWDEVPVAELGDFTLLSVPARYASIGDPGAAIDDAVGSLDALLELSARHEKEGLGDAPWPPNYAKQAGEPPRVQPSRKRRADTDYEGRGVDGGPPPEVAAERAAAVASGDPNAGLPTEWPGAGAGARGGPWTGTRPTPTGRRKSTVPVIEISRAKAKADALAGLERWKARHPTVVPLLEPADVLVDGMRGRSSLWYRVRVNLIHVPEADRPGQEALDPDYDPMTEWTPADRPDADVTEPETKAESKGAPKPKVAPKPKNVPSPSRRAAPSPDPEWSIAGIRDNRPQGPYATGWIHVDRHTRAGTRCDPSPCVDGGDGGFRSGRSHR